MVSVQSEKSVENIVQRRSRVSSQENGECFQCIVGGFWRGFKYLISSALRGLFTCGCPIFMFQFSVA